MPPGSFEVLSIIDFFFLYLSHLPPVGCDPSKGYFKAGGAFFGRDREWAAASVREKKGFKFLGFFVI
jgi:hypothetical protein